jgi:hypothetical protein
VQDTERKMLLKTSNEISIPDNILIQDPAASGMEETHYSAGAPA